MSKTSVPFKNVKGATGKKVSHSSLRAKRYPQSKRVTAGHIKKTK